mgnify:CR=1 FL=1
MLNTKFEIEENMGSIEKPRISKATLDKKADSSLVSILKQSFNQLEKQNKELKEEISEMNTYGNRILKENKELKQRNEFLENELKEIKELDDK